MQCRAVQRSSPSPAPSQGKQTSCLLTTWHHILCSGSAASQSGSPLGFSRHSASSVHCSTWTFSGFPFCAWAWGGTVWHFRTRCTTAWVPLPLPLILPFGFGGERWLRPWRHSDAVSFLNEGPHPVRSIPLAANVSVGEAVRMGARLGKVNLHFEHVFFFKWQ